MAEDRKGRLRRIYEEYGGSVYTYALRRTGSPEEAKDVVNDTFLVAWRRLESVPEGPLAWLLGTARRTAANHRRAADSREQLFHRARREVESAWTADRAYESGQQDDDAAGRARAALEELGDADRELLRLLYWDGLSGAEAARVLGCTRAALLVRAHRARQRFKQRLQSEWDGDAAEVEAGTVGGKWR